MTATQSRQLPEAPFDPAFDPKFATFLISRREVARIIDLCERFPSQVSHVIEGNVYRFIPETRDVHQQWIPNVLFTEWLFRFIGKLTHASVKRIGTLSYLKYSVGHHYKWHADVCPDHLDVAWRKWSGSIQLSEASDYDGGELQLRADPHDYVMEKEVGSVLMFNPEIAHRVTPVTRGLRRSLVFWIADEGVAAPQRR